MNITFEQVRGMLEQWINEVVNHVTTLFPHIDPKLVHPLVAEQINKAFTELLATRFAQLNGLPQ